jgi:hypothetical protein
MRKLRKIRKVIIVPKAQGNNPSQIKPSISIKRRMPKSVQPVQNMSKPLALPLLNCSNDFINLYKTNKINYEALTESCTFVLKNTNKVNVSIIIPVMGRENFHQPLIDHLNIAINKFSTKTFSITIVEHTNNPKHEEKSNKNNINYIRINKKDQDPFNKCLCMNVGSLYSNDAEYYLFHDIDILMNENYFIDIFKNIERVNNNSALQTFAGKRIIVMDQYETNSIIIHKKNLNTITPTYSDPGAPGGSIFVKAQDFKKVGGYDAEFFYGYSPEDAFFWHKLELMTNIQGCNNPVIEAYHMWHPPSHASNPDKKSLASRWVKFQSLQQEEKIKFINHISNEFKKLYK